VHVQRLVSIVKMATVLEEYTTEEQRSVMLFSVNVMTFNTLSNTGISSIKTVDVNINIYYVFNINVSVLHVSTISSGHHQAPMDITQVII
jgi:hypothetical protein